MSPPMAFARQSWLSVAWGPVYPSSCLPGWFTLFHTLKRPAPCVLQWLLVKPSISGDTSAACILASCLASGKLPDVSGPSVSSATRAPRAPGVTCMVVLFETGGVT